MPQHIKPGNLMPDQDLTGEQLSDVRRLSGDTAMKPADFRTPRVGIDSVAHQARLAAAMGTPRGLRAF